MRDLMPSICLLALVSTLCHCPADADEEDLLGSWSRKGRRQHNADIRGRERPNRCRVHYRRFRGRLGIPLYVVCIGIDDFHELFTTSILLARVLSRGRHGSRTDV